ncbi:hypothetical protein [Streptomyces sp. CH-036]|uniref:hypothetical protein n=1 Tax=Streptomyces sp. CH-036 TaxID=3406733 RepID=UPI003C744DF4
MPAPATVKNEESVSRHIAPERALSTTAVPTSIRFPPSDTELSFAVYSQCPDPFTSAMRVTADCPGDTRRMTTVCGWRTSYWDTLDQVPTKCCGTRPSGAGSGAGGFAAPPDPPDPDEPDPPCVPLPPDAPAPSPPPEDAPSPEPDDSAGRTSTSKPSCSTRSGSSSA